MAADELDDVLLHSSKEIFLHCLLRGGTDHLGCSTRGLDEELKYSKTVEGEASEKIVLVYLLPCVLKVRLIISIRGVDDGFKVVDVVQLHNFLIRIE